MRNPNIVVTESTNEAAINAPLQVLARLDPEGKACIFNPSTMHDQMIDCWHLGDAEPQPVPVYYYLSTKPLDDKSAALILKRYQKALGLFNVSLRQRLPRTFKNEPNKNVAKRLADKINKRSEAARARFEHDLQATSAAMQDVTSKAWSEGLDDATLQLAVKIAKILRETH